MSLAWLVIGFILGCAVLAWGADQFVKSSTVIARHYQVSPLVVGMVLVGFGTSCPELIVSLLASLNTGSLESNYRVFRNNYAFRSWIAVTGSELYSCFIG